MQILAVHSGPGVQILAGAKTGRARFKNLVVFWVQSDEKRLGAMGGSLEPQSQKCADPRGILSRSEQRAQATQAQTERTRFKNLAVFWAEGAKIRAWWGVKNLGPQSQECADSCGILSKSDQRAKATQMKTERARFTNLVVFWA